MSSMSRQINQDIFNEGYVPQTQGPPLTETDMLADPYYDEMASRVEKVRYEVQEWIKSVNLRLEKALQRMQSLEERLKQSAIENHERMAMILSRVKETQNSEFKFAALIER